MSLNRIDTGEAAKPLAQLQEMNKSKKTDLENSLLKEALTISNEKCNSLIERQNTRIEGLTYQVGNLNGNNDYYQNKIRETVQMAVTEIRQITQDERKFKTEISQTIKSEIGRSVNEVKNYALKAVDETVKEVKEQLKSTAKEIERQREDLKLQHGFRKFLFWATPILLLVQTVALVFLLLK